MDNYLKVIQQDIEKSLKNSYTTTLTLALTLNDHGIPVNFDTIAKKLLASNQNINGVQLVPNGIIKYVYPYEENKAAIGLDILKSSIHRKEALKSIVSQKMYFAGPFDLAQGGKGIVGRLPVYKNNKFWGFSAVVIRLEKLVNFFELNPADSSKYYLQLSKKDPNTSKEIFFLNESHNFSSQNYVSSIIPDGDWKLYLIEKNSSPYLDSQLILIAIFGLIISILIGVVTTSILDKPAKLRLLVAEQAVHLLNSELKFKAFFEQAAVGMANVKKETGAFIELNSKFCQLLGYTEEELKSKSFMEITHPEDLNKDLVYLEKLKNGLIDKYSLEKRYFKKNGDIVWVKLTVSYLLKTGDEESSYISIIENISKRKIAEKKSKEYQKRIESLINTIDGIVWECDAETLNFTFVSEKVKDILGFTAEEWLATPNFWQNQIHPDDKNQVLGFCSEKTALSADHDFEYRIVAKNGETVWLRDIVNVISANGSPSLLRGIMIDITKTKEIQNDLNNSFKLVTEQNKRLLNFSYIVSHNLRSHTSNITSLTDLIETSESEEETDEYVYLLKKVSSALNETLENLNEIVNIQSNISLVTEKINVSQYVNNTLKVLSNKIQSQGVKIKTLVSDEIEVIYNPAYLESILYNLISNAIRYRHPERNPEVLIAMKTENNKKVLQITDNGIGIDLDKNGSKIFGMYKTFSNNPDSRGVGLFITKNQIDAMGGKITIESEVNIGTTFKVYIS
ncbi:PAS domain S-box protein [Flavobacterium faecale]|uniref:PAS domain S-box protein n=1 Tax=Flavobacterium faecale TaxID=1355330 RepID=UPI003AAAA2A2